MGIGLLGPLRVDGGGSLERRDRIVLSVLAVHRGDVVSPEQFADALWAGRPPASWPKQVQICVARLRKVLGAIAIETVPGGYRLALDGEDVDSYRFERLVERARGLAATGEQERAAATFARALSLWRGRALDELNDWLPGCSEAARLEELRRTTEEDWLDSRLAAGEHRDVAVEAEALVAADTLREHRWAILALAQYRCGRQGDALRSLSRARETLADQLGIDPGSELVALEGAILRQDASLAAILEPATVSEACPYKGLAPYDVGDNETFFGRDAEVAACLERLRSTSLLLVAGPSGCGKSSLVRAGIVPALQQRGKTAVVFLPGSDPDGAMDAVASESDGAAVLVIDQFEELFALGHSPEVVRRFCQRTGEYARERAPVVIAVRSDHLGGFGIEPGLSRLAERGLHLVPPLVGDALRESIEQPAALAGLRLEHGLVELLVRDCEGEPGGLPLLSHALSETWRRRDGNVLTVEGYRATGGIRGAVARSADRVYDSLAGDQRLILRAVLLRLVTPSIEGEPVRCRVPSRSLLGDADRERIVALLVRARLVTSEEDTFELAHEALARAWPRLQFWLDDDAAGQRLLRHLTTAADGWESLGRPTSELYRGARLDTTLEWREATQPHLTDLERQFLDASVDQATSDSRAVIERARRDASQNRRLRTLLVATVVLLVASAIVGYVAVRQRELARSEGRVATARELAAAANANLTIDAERSVLLSLAAVEHSRSGDGVALPEAYQALHRAVAADWAELRVPGVGGTLDWSPDGRVFVTEGPQSSGTVDIRDARTGESVRSFHGHDVDVTDVAFNDDGTLLATTGADGAARVWDPATGEQLHTVESSGGRGAWGPAFSAEGSYFAAAWPDDHGGIVRVLDLATGQIVREIDAVPSPVATSFHPTAARIAIASNEQPIAVVVDIESGDDVFTAAGHFHVLRDVAWSPDGLSIATASDDGSARLFDAETGHQRFALLGHLSNVIAVAWSPDSTRLVTGSADGTAKLWSLIEGDGRELATLSAHDTRKGVRGVAFSPDGAQVMTGDGSSAATIIWDVGVTAGAEVANLPAVSYHFGDVEFSPDDHHLVASSGGGSITVWEPRTRTAVQTFGDPTPSATEPSGIQDVPVGTDADVQRLAVDPTGVLVAGIRSAGKGLVEVWDGQTGQDAFAIRAGSGLPSVTWSPDGGFLAAGGDDGVVTIVDRSGREVTRLEHPGAAIGSVAFTPDGDRLVATVEAAGPYEPNVGKVVLWDWRAGEIERSIDAEARLAVASPTGDLIAVGSHWNASSPPVEIWNATTGQLVASLAGHTGAVSDLTFSPDGSILATASEDGTIRLWDPRSGEQQLVLHGTIGAVSAVSFNRDGSQLASVGVEGVVRIWALDLDELIDIARSRLTRQLTDAECRQYLHASRCPDAG
jgi:WD40 repeat protein/DNA-binding SARP family transcriptional activator